MVFALMALNGDCSTSPPKVRRVGLSFLRRFSWSPRARRLSGFAAVIVSALVASQAWAAPTTVSLRTRGTLRVDRQGGLSANLSEGLPSSGFFDVYTGTFT